jgi:thioredoxin reductase
MQANSKITLIPNTSVVKINGENKVEGVTLDVEIDGGIEYKTDGVFIEIGSGPNTTLLTELDIELNDRGYIKVNPDQSTNIENFYAIGDISTNSNGFRQIITAGAEGSIAAISIFEKKRREKSEAKVVKS